MQTERQREAAEFRGQGSQRAQEIRARADRDVTVLLAEATSKAEQTRGEGDAERNRIFADGFSKDPEFFAFYRSMQAYEAGLKHGETRMVLKPDTDFFRYFNDPTGKGGQAAKNGSSTNSLPEKSANSTGGDPDKGDNSKK
jgi:membrane protease subunit HflC